MHVEGKILANVGNRLNHCMLRIKDPSKSVAFYEDVLGAQLLERFDFDKMGFSLFFLGFEAGFDKPMPEDRGERIMWLASQSGVLELTHNHGTESDSDFDGYHNGNSDPKGFGHICVSVPDVYKACSRFEELGVEFVKRPDDGSMKGIAFIKDPDGYWIEIFSPVELKNLILNAS
ncbi:lactoylglutathione lyase [Litorivicinus sp.]|nr:lactoylglutathione lyase [Litorivicinus sp.]MDC1240835.1 lactoylglutathione lyase [Litorivicinus sp.]MDC1466447.1 lactoylglutathione lyase [Litorivicinus sp.]